MPTREMQLGDEGEEYACELLRARGWTTRRLGLSKLVDIEASRDGRTVFISVKTSRTKQHARLGPLSIVRQFRDEHVYMILLPAEKLGAIQLSPGGYKLLIVPGRMAREDALYVTETYLSEPKRDGTRRKDTGSVMVKGYSTRPVQKEAWARWLMFQERWDILETS